MFGFIQQWLDRRRQLRALWKADARILLRANERTAYYEAQRLVARSRARGDNHGFWHWAKVAAEIARLSDNVEMDLATLKAIAAEELNGARKTEFERPN
ncbi:hypothetical protein [Hyphomicrobium sp. LHD-15]|uniref:hypothetical protein n=1 Tax=Hyphomicrobium sp. LHD-15 TaxID=3072142 RepID=UPI00280CDA9D|nr:hypothetical protein [Hyphomicrobium sp. LHD-15]MDQ8700600.1 hypothetical protein [Hyphomicrobium sp. LHD-15]